MGRTNYWGQAMGMEGSGRYIHELPSLLSLSLILSTLVAARTDPYYISQDGIGGTVSMFPLTLSIPRCCLSQQRNADPSSISIPSLLSLASERYRNVSRQVGMHNNRGGASPVDPDPPSFETVCLLAPGSQASQLIELERFETFPRLAWRLLKSCFPSGT